jgi:peptidoglycan/LPS O-acetylase OafA/YrhL
MLNPKPMNRIAHVDGLRAVAVLSVLAYHLGFAATPGGFVGVDVFFVISGYVITRMLRKDIDQGRFSFVRFYVGRARRLLPALFVTIAFTAVVAGLIMTPAHLQEFAGSVISAVLGWSNIFFWSKAGYFDAAANTRPLLHTWTLSVEWQFYVIWPAFLLAVLAVRKAWFAPAAIALAAVVSLAANIYFQNDPTTIFYQMPFRILEFAIGALILWVPPVRTRLPGDVATALGLALIGYATVTYSEQTLFPSYNALPPALGAALVIWGAERGALGWIVANPLAAYLGRISYSTYLVHWPLIICFSYVQFRALTVAEAWAIGGISIALGAAMYQWVELPFWKGRLSRMPGWRGPLVTAGAAALLIVPSAHALSDGWSWRLSEATRLQAGNAAQFHLDEYGGAGFEVNMLTRLGEGDPKLIVAGDSHALQFAFGLSEELAGRGASAIALFDHGCFIGPDVTRYGTTSGDQQECTSEYAKLIGAMQGNSLPLVMANNWTGYKDIIGPPGQAALTFPDYDQYYDYVFGKLDEIKAAAGDRRLIVIGTVPGSGDVAGVADCLFRPELVRTQCVANIDRPVEKSSGYAFNRLLADWALRNSAEYVDLYETFCPDGLCRPVIDGKILYSDGGHLSKDGSLLAASALVDELLTAR